MALIEFPGMAVPLYPAIIKKQKEFESLLVTYEARDHICFTTVLFAYLQPQQQAVSIEYVSNF